jgi:hypothetical protein
MSLTLDERQQALTYAINGAMFMFRATIKFASEMASGGPASEGMIRCIPEMLMTRQWINLDNDTVIKYCNRTLDKKNTYVLDNSDIKVIPEPIDINTGKVY